ncbi:hypothetical protein ElyMa_006578300 [Elysia marginata]|uniref:Uncharacterized protein n=1 Tax=Elysia marginata TaxID=1093978 RepID=A0AAV4IBE5_9GAST|nr:hypothetical protein ElyMa_006578300 [Elysia marginata]
MLERARDRCVLNDPYNITCREADDYRLCLSKVVRGLCEKELGQHADNIYKLHLEPRVPANCQKAVWKPSRSRLEAVWKPPGSRLETAWKPSGSRLEAVWKPPGSRLEAIWKLPGSRLEAV